MSVRPRPACASRSRRRLAEQPLPCQAGLLADGNGLLMNRLLAAVFGWKSIANTGLEALRCLHAAVLCVAANSRLRTAKLNRCREALTTAAATIGRWGMRSRAAPVRFRYINRPSAAKTAEISRFSWLLITLSQRSSKPTISSACNPGARMRSKSTATSWDTVMLRPVIAMAQAWNKAHAATRRTASPVRTSTLPVFHITFWRSLCFTIGSTRNP